MPLVLTLPPLPPLLPPTGMPRTSTRGESWGSALPLSRLANRPRLGRHPPVSIRSASGFPRSQHGGRTAACASVRRRHRELRLALRTRPRIHLIDFWIPLKQRGGGTPTRSSIHRRPLRLHRPTTLRTARRRSRLGCPRRCACNRRRRGTHTCGNTWGHVRIHHMSQTPPTGVACASAPCGGTHQARPHQRGGRCRWLPIAWGRNVSRLLAIIARARAPPFPPFGPLPPALPLFPPPFAAPFSLPFPLDAPFWLAAVVGQSLCKCPYPWHA